MLILVYSAFAVVGLVAWATTRDRRLIPVSVAPVAMSPGARHATTDAVSALPVTVPVAMPGGQPPCSL